MRAKDPRGATVAAPVAQALLARAAAAGLDAPGLLARVGIDPALLADVDGRVPAAAVRALWEELPRACNDPALGLNLAAAVPDRALGVVAYLILHAPTLGQGFAAAVRHAGLLQDVAVCTLGPGSRPGNLVFAQIPRPNAPAPPRHAVEFAFARVVHMARRSTGHPISPVAVRFAFPRPGDTRAHETAFQAPLVFDHPRNELELDEATLRLPQRTADPWLHELIERHARAALAQLQRPEALAARVTELLGRAIQGGTGDLASVARALSMPPRTLQRRLAAEGVSFRRLADDVRRALACQLLRNGVGLAEIALLLGFSEQAPFQRAFLRWTGATPGHYRRAHRPAPPAA
ncbi:MAG TPA: AraC family transcriptional regulator [Polyangia bacterium]|nr:AraC family transcriptional regulator [Polyangia bacterium]